MANDKIKGECTLSTCAGAFFNVTFKRSSTVIAGLPCKGVEHFLVGDPVFGVAFKLHNGAEKRKEGIGGGGGGGISVCAAAVADGICDA